MHGARRPRAKSPGHTCGPIVFKQESLRSEHDTITPMDEVFYKGIRITPQPRQLQGGGWVADFTLFVERGSATDTKSYDGKNVYPTREDAELAALDSARRVIEEEY